MQYKMEFAGTNWANENYLPIWIVIWNDKTAFVYTYRLDLHGLWDFAKMKIVEVKILA